MDENKHLKNENNDLTERINNLSYILADLQQKTKNAEQERDSAITAMRLLIAETNGVVENNNVVEQKLCNEADECTQSKDVINPNIELSNRFSVLENEQVNVDKLGATSNQKTEEDKEQKKKKSKTKAKKKQQMTPHHLSRWKGDRQKLSNKKNDSLNSKGKLSLWQEIL